jgi:hypothetical protein
MITIPVDGNSRPIERAMGVPVVQDSRVLVSNSKYVDMFVLSGKRVYRGISVYNPGLAALYVAIGGPFANTKCISVPATSTLTFDEQSFGAIGDLSQGIEASTNIRAMLGTASGVAATGTITFSVNMTDQKTVVINGFTYEFSSDASPIPGNTFVPIGATLAITLASLVTVINSTDQAITASATATVLTLTSNLGGTEANNIALGAGSSGATVSGAILSGATGGVTPTIHIW